MLRKLYDPYRTGTLRRKNRIRLEYGDIRGGSGQGEGRLEGKAEGEGLEGTRKSDMQSVLGLKNIPTC